MPVDLVCNYSGNNTTGLFVYLVLQFNLEIAVTDIQYFGLKLCSFLVLIYCIVIMGIPSSPNRNS